MAQLRTQSRPTLMNIDWVPRNTIKFWSGNPRRNAAAALKLADLLRANGIRSPINVWEKDMVAYKGNTTLKALDIISTQGPGADDHPSIVHLYEKGKEKTFLVPIIKHAFQSKEAAIAYGLSDNKASEFADWDDELLPLFFEQKNMAPFLASTGFKEKEISTILWNPQKEIDNTAETNSGLMGKIGVFCQPEDKEQILEILQKWADDSGFQGVVIK